MRVCPEAVRRLGSTYVYSQYCDVGGQVHAPHVLNDKNFCSYFFLCPAHTASLFTEVCDTFTELEYYQNGVTYTVKFLLWTLFFLKTYCPLQMCADWVGVSRKTFKKHLDKTLEALSVVYAENVSSWE